MSDRELPRVNAALGDARRLASAAGVSPSELSGVVDRHFARRLADVWPVELGAPDEAPFAVCALGDYGRGELCLHSDIELLLVYEKAIPPEALDLAQSLLSPLWDAGFDVTHSFRSIKETLSLARADFAFFASLLDARPVAGSPDIFDSFSTQFAVKVMAKKRQAFLSYLERFNAVRLRRQGDASTLLEPDVREGVGGLRDVHQVLWLGRVFHGAAGPDALVAQGLFTQQEKAALDEQVGFVLAVQNALHVFYGRRDERLTRDALPVVAARFKGQGGADGAALLGRLHRCMASFKALRASFMAALPDENGRKRRSSRVSAELIECGGELHLDPGVEVAEGLAGGMDILRQSAELGLALSWQARRALERHVDSCDTRQADGDPAVAMFRAALRSGHVRLFVSQMLETGALEALVPEFCFVRDFVQFDDYHIHTVGRHTVNVMAALDGAQRQVPEVVAGAWRLLDDVEPLFLAALFHDLGKGAQRGHAERGARVAREVLERWGVDGALVEDVVFLVRNHLVLRHTAQRRDIDDESEVAGCAAVIGSPRRLAMLHVLTWADAVATGPEAWTRWIARQVAELAERVQRMMERGGPSGADSVRRVLRVRDGVRAALEAAGEGDIAEAVLDAMPTRYALAVELPDILRHVSMLRTLHLAVEEDRRVKPGGRGGEGVFVRDSRYLADADAWEIAVAASYTPDLFAAATGVLTLMEVNILAASSFLWRDGTAVDVFIVNGLPESMAPEELWKRVDYSLRAALSGRLSLDARLAELRGGVSPVAEREVDVAVGADASDFHTVIEVEAPDRLGVLYDMACAFRDQGLDVVLAKVATRGERATDVFYVREGGRKVASVQRLREIGQALRQRLAPGPVV
ncbi:[protein-PII] uridylyltransferase [Desulfobaculum xiamenense]|uniref:Bifunctional uridylyltransferase/uridylyl-removing enzyme n=1 Tax=Desulfobaculum xiamenense TaxID=995050 RepID=A0A846QR52_9BACT|nr:HD domain-containing protein [Desulfobaculum xiamenense]NJB68853.1 [protein-PII] uridylyltransferase [Desulfobaculum xiamenense]